ncbi:2-oxoisovalerate dehydrogenase subunit alpha, mitochondrial [Cyclospora cayetanensis]|uniref:2-oxoisovalerate dehydrogenase subunit alpha n=1 Tax=Cyclospora cayetanensis TaxID=88456 RepID=A0A6P6S0V6_9EIME|nr:2-oxoisovalerate dehydrogenase subunit alpha, mitochondrial [Cyclospora cayetanensis]
MTLSLSLTARRYAGTSSKTQVYHEGLIHTEFTTELNINKETPVIPIFRILTPEGHLEQGWENPFSKEETIDMYKFMVRLSVWDNMLYNVQRQGRFSFYIQNQGEEATQAGIGKALMPEDHIFLQYRELGVLMMKGFTLEDTLGQLLSTKHDEGKGRQMPISYSKQKIGLHTICTPLTTQVPHSMGAGYAFRLGNEKRISVGFFGEGAASEGDFHAAANFAATLKGNTLLVCRNNGYAISTPVKDQYAGDGIAIRGISYGMRTIRVDGNDLFASYLATKAARDIILETQEPVLMEFMTYRVGQHSTSDDSSAYRQPGELEAWNASGILPIARVRKYMDQQGWWSEQEDEALRKDARTVMLAKMKEAEKVKRWPILEGLFADVWSHPVDTLEEQKEAFKKHFAAHKDKYNLSKYEGL